ncbi:MAG: GH13_16 / GH13_36 / GH13 / GH13_31 / GH13_ 40 / GH13_23 / GH13_17 / GH13_29 / GH13_4 / GH13 _30 / GH13_35 / GH13_20 / GH13_2 / GH13_18 / GH13 _34 / GH13_1 / GH13_21 / GH13_19 / GH13_26 [uncultured Propionibacteriaceae bacterium]|uniref:Alpha-amylase n=1 Tax=uncultured Propionibacteriaceae bacterium TaxID=257457 RepID=A0A6J4PIM5_9ACTN|nr:MAG: GH13_16 / GH13_36 / GH13 / GH13_31 / GH13_ 40 / GH13_23 / GH13_17 / GH13_29 / GH13_4 / GH13 _30 / GH13_35 / GH13_20 / GH13_2 / GH13_18 / GH13 _34 / GH13_1 / GH13_21 / GH13_19 / GH13_26 [uncultured Propionibacteriaceae bacterium]
MSETENSNLWWKNAVVYCLDIETFFDSDGDGIGDLPGLHEQIDYIAELGVTCLWLMPFYPTPNRDDGYDITDYYGVDQRLGSLGDVVELIRAANNRGIRVIADLVVNHTSAQHPWFQAARSSKESPFRDFYIWRSNPPPDTSAEVVFPDQENSLWELDEQTGEWYFHRFYKQQPDLNISNPRVRREITKMMAFWLQLGMSGFRVDAVPFLIETMGLGAEALAGFGEPHGYLRSLRSFVSQRNGEAILLGEVNLPYEQQLEFFGPTGDELSMMFEFIGMQHLYLALARADSEPLVNALKQRPAIPPASQWATFVRNHDELTLDKLPPSQRQEVFDAFGPEKRMQLYGRGLKRRLPPMLNGDPQRIRMVYSLLFSLPGTPVLFYGEEIGMGENLKAEGRKAVRTPMQWTSQPNGGFSTAPRQQLISDMAEDGFGPEMINVLAQRGDTDSLLSFVTQLVHRYRDCPELGWGEFKVIDQPHRGVLAHTCTWQGRAVLAVHNFSDKPVTMSLTLPDFTGHVLRDLFGGANCEVSSSGSAELSLDGYGYRWLRAYRKEDRWV